MPILEKIQAAFEAHHYLDAITITREALRQNGESLELRIRLAINLEALTRTHLQLGRASQFSRAFEDVLGAGTNQPIPRAARSAADCLEAIAGVLKNDPGEPRAWSCLGKLLHELGMDAQGTRALEIACLREPENPRGWFEMVMVHEKIPYWLCEIVAKNPLERSIEESYRVVPDDSSPERVRELCHFLRIAIELARGKDQEAFRREGQKRLAALEAWLAKRSRTYKASPVQ